MWATSQGDRTLVADEAQLFLLAVGYLHDMITAGVDFNEPYQTGVVMFCLLYTSPSPRDATLSRMPSSA